MFDLAAYVLIMLVDQGNSSQIVTADFSTQDACIQAVQEARAEFVDVRMQETRVAGAMCPHKGDLDPEKPDPRNLILLVGNGAAAQAVTVEFNSKAACISAIHAAHDSFFDDWHEETRVTDAICPAK